MNQVPFPNLYYYIKQKERLFHVSISDAAVTRIRTWVASATTKSTNHYTITAIADCYETERRKIYTNETSKDIVQSCGQVH